MDKRTWLVTYRSKRGGILRRRFYSEWDARLFMETTLSEVHPADKTLDGPDGYVSSR